jgi:hypothetical protein
MSERIIIFDTTLGTENNRRAQSLNVFEKLKLQNSLKNLVLMLRSRISYFLRLRNYAVKKYRMKWG